MAKNAAMAEAAQLAEESMDLFRRALRQKAARRQAAAETQAATPSVRADSNAASGSRTRANG